MPSLIPPRFSAYISILAAAFGPAAGPASALTHSVTDFRNDWTGNAADTLRLDAGWRDSLLMSAQRFEYKTAKVARLNNDPQGGILNTPGASATAAVTGMYAFKVAYALWAEPHNASNAGTAKVANILVRNVVISPDTADLDAAGTIIAGQEVPGKQGPVFLNFKADGDRYAAYWGSNSPPGPIRRTTHKEAQSGASAATWGTNVNPSAPVTASGYGKVGAGMQPGSGGAKWALAYETQSFPTGKFEVRWEDIEAGTSVASATYNTAVNPEDFAVALDSLGNTVVMWRQNQTTSQGAAADMWMAAFDPSRAEIIPPTKLHTDILSDDTVSNSTSTYTHYARPFAIAAITKWKFYYYYCKRLSAASGQLYQNSILIDSTGGAAHVVSTPNTVVFAPVGSAVQMYPDIHVAADQAVVAWFQRSSGFKQRMLGSIFKKKDRDLDYTQRTDLDLAGEDIAWGAPTNGLWYQYHGPKVASVAIDDKGNVLAAYDSGSAAKAALVKNTPIYYDSAAFLSKSIQVRNPAIPAFTFNPATDSVAFMPFRFSNTDSARTRLKLAVSANNDFSAPNYQVISARTGANTGYFRYKVEMLTNKTASPTTSNLTTPKVKSLDIDYNVKPWRPQVDSIKPGSFPIQAYNPASGYPLLPRKDSLKLVCSAFDVDDNGLDFRISLGSRVLKTVAGTRTSAGNYAATLVILPPDTVLNPLPLTLTTVDAGSWASQGFQMLFDYSNITPTQTVSVFRNRSRDSASVYRPNGGGTDTLRPADGELIVMQAGDSISVKARYADGNDDNITATWLRNSTQLGTRVVPTTDSLTFRFAPDNANPVIDTLVMRVGDPNITTTLRFPVRPNRLPVIDSVFHSAYKGKDSAWKTGPYDKAKLDADTGLILPSGLMTVVDLGVNDTDLILGDTLAVKWRVWKPAFGCPRGDLTCHTVTDSLDGAPFTRVFNTQEQYLTVRVTDRSGAFRERKLWLEYPVLDTSGSGGFAAAVKALGQDIDFIIGSDDHDTTVKAEIVSQGSTPLIITSVATKGDDRKWLNVKLDWLTGTPPRPDSVKFTGSTAANALTGGKTISLPPGAKLTFNFRFQSDSLRGDSSFTDTLLVGTNDFANPVLKIPFRMVYNDLPVMTLGVPGSTPAGPANGYNAAGLPRFVPARSSLSVSFTETVRVPDPAAVFRVYSYLDSLKAKRNFRFIKGRYSLVRTRSPKVTADARGMAFGKAAATVSADSLADQIVFTPEYDRPSDSLGVTPEPGFFIYRDVIRVKLSNGIVDRAGNGLDLRLNKKAAAPGSLDTVFQARIDTNTFKVARTEPKDGDKDWNPEAPIRVRFNRKLSRPAPEGSDTLTLLRYGPLKYADSRAVKVTSVFRPDRPYDFQAITLEDGDSTLVIRTRPRLPALDTVTVTLSGGLIDTAGLSLDGNGDRFPDWLYDRRDSVDAHTFSFATNEAQFYVFPNPFRFSDSRHREKGSITFKNLNSLRGYAKAAEVTLRVHTMGGDLVFDSGTRPSSPVGPGGKRINTSLDWDLKNNHSSGVGTGVYVYSLMTGRTLLHKGKVAVVR